MAWWYRDLRAGIIDRVEQVFEQLTEPLPGPQPWSVTICRDSQRCGFAVVADGGLLTATPERGVHWISLASVSERLYRSVKA